MKVLFSWLKDYVDIKESVERVCERLVEIGFEVEDVIDLSKTFTNIRVGEILSVEKHPDADRLRVCKVDIGDEIIQIVTNATSVNKGDKVPVALDGARLATGQVIKKGLLRGVESDGMFCGGEELGANDSVYFGASGDSVLVLEKNEKTGASMVDVLGYNDYILDVNVTPNRPDCNSILGIAGEVGAAFGLPVSYPDISYDESNAACISDFVQAHIEDSELCPNYNMQAVFDIEIKPSPLWMTRRLHALGLRSINNMVDITNYVLFELGQPMHAFDGRDIKDKTIIVRRAKDGEKIVPLDEKEYALNRDVLVIADKSTPIGLAGIMGGFNSGVKNETKTVVFESAKFAKENIRRSSRRLGLRSDSSARFEKGVDAYTADFALSRALHLVQKLGCGKIATGRIAIGEKSEKRELSFCYDRVKKLIGIDIPEERAVEILKALRIDAKIEKGLISCIIPENREDIQRDCDIIEELIRIYGYNNLKPTLFEQASVTAGGRSDYLNTIKKAKEVLVGEGYSECRTYSFGAASDYEKLNLSENSEVKRTIKLLNPLSEDLAVMRTTLAVNMLNVIASNISKKNEDLKLFELAKCFIPYSLPLESQPKEEERLCIAMCGDGDYFDLMNCVDVLLKQFNISYDLQRSQVPYLHPGVSADIVAEGKNIGYIGKLHPSVYEAFQLNKKVFLAELDFEKIFDLTKAYPKYVPYGKYPASVRDLAIVVPDSVLAQDIERAILKASELVTSVKLFDLYKGISLGAFKSLAYSVVFSNNEKTLTDAEVDGAVKRILKALEYKFGAKLRS